MHCLFVDGMAHTSTSQKSIRQIMKAYSKNFEYTSGDFMTSFLGLDVEQGNGVLRLHLDTNLNVQEMLEDDTAYIKRSIKPRRVPMLPGDVLNKDDVSETPHEAIESLSFFHRKDTICGE